MACCSDRKSRLKCTGTTLLILGIALIIVGATGLLWVQDIFEALITRTVSITGDKVNRVPKIGSQYGGPVAPEDDNGERVEFYFSHITNLKAALETGVDLEAEEIGPIAYRKYQTYDYDCPTCKNDEDAGVQTWYERIHRYFQPDRTTPTLRNYSLGSNWDNTFVVVPNIAYRAFEGAVKQLTQNSAATFESVAVPLFSVSTLQSLRTSLPYGLQMATLRVGISTMYKTLVTEYATANSVDANTAAQVILDRFRSASAEPSQGYFKLSANVENTLPFQVVAALFKKDTDISLLDAPTFSIWFSALAAIGTPNEAAAKASLTEYFHLHVFDETIYNYELDSPVMEAHIFLILRFLGQFTSKEETSAVTSLKHHVASFYKSEGVIDTDDFNDLLVAQLNGNGVLGVSSGAIGPALDNNCEAAHSLSSIPFIASLLPGGMNVEFNCFLYRHTPALSFRSRIPNSKFASLLTTMTSGPAMIASLDTIPSLQGTGRMAAFMTGFSAMAAMVRSQMGLILTSQSPTDAFFITHFLPIFQAINSNQDNLIIAEQDEAASCVHASYNPLQLDLPCHQIFDLGNYFNYLAKDVTFTHQFVEQPPIVNNAGTFGAHPNSYWQNVHLMEANLKAMNISKPMRAGPFLRCTIREVMEIGCHDNFIDYVQQLLSQSAPGAATSRNPPIAFQDYSDDSAYAAWKSTRNGPSSRYNGKGDLSLNDEAILDNGRSSITIWGGPKNSNATSTPVKGSYTGLAFAPGLDVKYDVNAPVPTRNIWLTQAQRHIMLTFTEKVKDVTGQLDLWRYEFSPSSTVVSYEAALNPQKSDDNDHTPYCSANIAATSSLAPIYLGKPYFYDCDWDMPGYAKGFVYPSLNTSAERLSTFIDIEPISGMTLLARKRLGPHMRWGPSSWYPNLKNIYGSIYWLDNGGEVHPVTANKIVDSFNLIESVKYGVVPGVLGAVGGVFIIVAMILIVKSKFTDPSVLTSTAPKNVPGNLDV